MNDVVTEPCLTEAAWLPLVAEAAEWRLIGLLLSAPRDDAWRRQIASLASDVRDPALQESARLAAEQADEGLYDSAFGPGGPTPPREVSYRTATLSSQFLAELAGLYDAFGYASPYDEPVDHVAVVTDFMAYLRLKEAFAAVRGDADQQATARSAAEYVVSEHLAHLAAPLAERLAAAEVGYLAGAAQSLACRVGPTPASAAAAAAELAVLPTLAGDQQGWACAGEASDRWKTTSLAASTPSTLSLAGVHPGLSRS